MVTVNAEARDMSLKPNQLRKKGMVPGVLYGKNLEESLSIQFSQAEAARFLKSNSTGSKAQLVIGNKKFSTLLRETKYKPRTGDLQHLSFQALLADELVTSMARIILLNKEKVPGIVHQPQAEVSYRALPSHLVEKIEIDLEGMEIGASMRISDLDIADNPDIEVLSPLDAMVFSIADIRRATETPETDEAEEAETQ
jgi:large subunit ribosomal protein L25